MQTKLVFVLFQWLRHNPVPPCDPIPLAGNFKFTEDGSVLVERWRVNLEVTKPGPDMLKLKIPAFVPSKSISAPAGTIALKCHIAVAGCTVESGVATVTFLLPFVMIIMIQKWQSEL